MENYYYNSAQDVKDFWASVGKALANGPKILADDFCLECDELCEVCETCNEERAGEDDFERTMMDKHPILKR